MKRNLKSILKYFVCILITALVTTVIFKLSKQLYRIDDDGIVQWETNHADKQYSNQFSKIDWHDWEFINVEKQRTGNI